MDDDLFDDDVMEEDVDMQSDHEFPDDLERGEPMDTGAGGGFLSADLPKSGPTEYEGLFPNDWRRPELKQLPDPKEDDIVFQQIDIDHYVGPYHKGILEGNIDPMENRNFPIMRMYGITNDDHSVMIHVHGFIPYFYVKIPSSFRKDRLQAFQQQINDQAAGEIKNASEDMKQIVLAVELVRKESMYGFNGNQKSDFLKIYVALPKYVGMVSRMLEKNSSLADTQRGYVAIFESNIDYDIRFMIDMKVVGCNWITVPKGKYILRRTKYDKKSICQIEADVFVEDFISHAPEGDWAKVAPFRVCSFDIECAGRKGIFPDPQHDPVIQIASVVIRQGDPEPLFKTIFCLGKTSSIVGVTVKCFKTEKELLCHFADFIRAIDPDILTGYNIQNFDLYYLLTRADVLQTITFPFLGRMKNTRTICRNKMLQSKQLGKRENKDINIEGRAQFDLLLVLLRDYKLRSYTLNAVSYHFLNEQKEDVHHSQITGLQNGDESTRRRLAVYCVKDAVLPIRLLDKLMCIINYMEMARVTGVPLGYLLTRGQQIKVVSQLLRKAQDEGLLMPTVKPSQGDDFEGALVIEPEKGYYNEPIATLDFTSLYPSIMMAHNLCYTTLVSKSTRSSYDQNDVTETPVGSLFIKANVRKGLLPKILEDLLGARKKAKADLKNETDPFKRKVLDGRQLALKISANSVYGFTGAQVGKLPCLDISKSVTAFGRQMIDQTKTFVETNFTKEKGYPADAKVIYGDTDSVMVKFGLSEAGSVAEAMELGRVAAKMITEIFPRPINLDFEKVYYPYLLINKKRYAGLYWTKPEKWDKMDCKGIETVRRDNCPLVSHLINNCLQKLLIDKDPKAATRHAQKIISDLLQNRVDISQLIITKELTKSDGDYANKQAHVELAARMTKRDAGSAPKLGDRVPYVIIAASKGTAAYLKSEDPIFVLENNIPIDVQYYLENQISKPLLRIFEPIIGKDAEKKLLKGDHTRHKTVVTSKVGALAKFCVKTETCLGCRAALRKENSGESLAVCKYCEKKEGKIMQVQLAKMNDLEVKLTDYGPSARDAKARSRIGSFVSPETVPSSIWGLERLRP